MDPYLNSKGGIVLSIIVGLRVVGDLRLSRFDDPASWENAEDRLQSTAWLVTAPLGDRSVQSPGMENSRLIEYLRYRRSSLRHELTWLRDRIVRGVDVQEEDEAIVLALSRELVEVSGLLGEASPPTRLH